MDFLPKYKQYLLQMPDRPSPVTIKNYLADVRKFISWYEANHPQSFHPEHITHQVISQYEQALRNVTPQTGRIDSLNKTTASELSIRRYLSSLRKFFATFKMYGLIAHDPFKETLSNTSNHHKEDPYKLVDFKNYLYVYNASRLTIKNYLLDVKQFLTWAQEVTRASEAWHVKDKDLFHYLDTDLVAEYKRRLMDEAGLSPLSVNRKLSSLRKYLGWAHDEGFLKNQNVEPRISNVENKERSTDEAAEARIKNLAFGVRMANTEETMISDLEAEKTEEELSPEMKNPGKSVFGAPGRLFRRGAKAVNWTFDLLIVAPLATVIRHGSLVLWEKTGKSVFQPVEKIFKSSQNVSNLIKKAEQASQTFSSQMPQIASIKKSMYAPHAVSLAGLPWHKKAWHHARHTRPAWYYKYHSYPVAHYLNFAVLIVFMAAIGVASYNAFVSGPGHGKQALAALPTAPPRVLSFQARLTDATDNPITASKDLRFAIYNSDTSSGSALLWQEVKTVTPDQDGIFSVLLGQGTTIPQSLFADNSALYLGITVGSDTELAPRQQLATVAYAANSETLQGLLPITAAGAGTSNVVLALDSSGDLTIGGAASPTFQATGGQFTLSGQVLTLTTTSGSNGNVEITPDGLGKIDFQKPIQNSTNNNNVSSALGAVEVDDLMAVLATSSGQSAFTVNQNGSGPIISASSSGLAKFTVDGSGNGTFAGDLAVNGNSLTTSATTFNLANTGAINLNIGGVATAVGIGATSGNTTVNNNLVVTGTATFNGGAIISSGQNLTVSGNVASSLIPSNPDTYDLGSTGSHWNNLYVNNIYGASTGVNGFWQRTLGSLAPTNITDALNLGATATSSAVVHLAGTNGSTDYSFFNGGNVGIGTTSPTNALLDVNGSANLASNLLFTKQTNHTIQLSNSTTANTAGGTLTIQGATGTGTGHGGDLSISAGDAQNGGGNARGGNITVIAGDASNNNNLTGGSISITSGRGGGNVNGTGGPINITGGNGGGSSSTGGAISLTTGTGGVVSGSSGALTLGTGTVTSGNFGTISVKQGANTRMFVKSDGNVGIGTTSPGALLDVNGDLNVGGYATAAASLAVGYSNAPAGPGNAIFSGNVGIGTTSTGTYNLNVSDSLNATNYYVGGTAGSTIGTASCVTTSGGIVTGSAACPGGSVSPFQELSGAIVPNNSTEDLLLGGQATSSAKFAVLNMSGTNSPVASVSSGLNGNGVYLTADGTLATTRRTDLTLGNSSTYNTTGNILLNPNGVGNVGIGTTNPDAPLHVLYANSTATNPALELESSGTQSSLAFKINTGVRGLISTDDNGIKLQASNNKTVFIGGSSLGTIGQINFQEGKAVFDTNGNLGIGTTSPTALLHVSGGTTGGNAVAIFDQKGALTNDIIAASSSGLTKFRIANAGTIYAPALYDIDNTSFFLDPAATATSLTTNGAAGIGTSSPIGMFNVNGAVAGKALANLTYTGTDQNILTASHSGTTVFTMDKDGNITVGSGGTGKITAGTIDPYLISNQETDTNTTLTFQTTAASGGDFLFKNQTTDLVKIMQSGDIIPQQTGLNIGSAANPFNTVYADNVIATGNTSGFWQRTLGSLAPANITDSLNLGATATGSAVVHLAGTSGNTDYSFFNGGNVGIGTTNPTAKLDVNGDASTSGSLVFNGSNKSIDVLNGSRLDFNTSVGGDTGLATAMTILNNGNVGIGTTTPASLFSVGSTSQFQIDSAGAITAAGITSSGNISFSTLSAGGLVKADATTGKLSIASSTTDYQTPLTFSNGISNNSGTVTLGGTLTGNTDIPLNNYNLTLSGSGNLGIGTTSPTAPLHIVSANSDQIIIDGDQAATGVLLRAYGTTSSSNFPYLSGRSARGTLAAPTATQADDILMRFGGAGYTGSAFGSTNKAQIQFQASQNWTTTNNGAYIAFSTTPNNSTTLAERLRVDASGNVGIGTTSPGSLLDVAGDASTAKLYLKENGSTTGADNAYLTERPNSAIRRIMMYGTPQSNSFGFIVAPTGTTKTDVKTTLWATDIDNGGTSNYAGLTFGANSDSSNLNFSTTIADTDTGDIYFSPKGTEMLRLSAANNRVTFPSGNVGIGTTSTGSYKLNVSGNINATGYYAGGTAGVTVGSASCVTTTGGIVTGSAACAGPTSSPFWNQNLGALYPNNSTEDLLIGGQATTSAKFAVLNMNSGTPVASVSSGLNGNGAYLTADGTLATTRRTDLTLGNSSTYNTTGNVLINPNGTGNVGIGTTSPISPLDINGTAASYKGGSMGLILRDGSQYFSHLYNNSLGIMWPFYIEDAGGNARAIFGIDYGSSSPNAYLNLPGTQNFYFITGGDPTNKLMSVLHNGNVGIGTTAPNGLLDVDGAVTGKALVVFNQTGNQDIFTASKSGSTIFTLGNDGTLTDSKYATNGGVLYTDTSGVVQSSNTATDGYILQSNSGTPTWVAASGLTAGNVGFAGIDSGTNTHAAMVVGTGASLTYSGTGTINASSLESKTWETPGTIGSTTPNSGAFTTLSSSGLATLNDLSVTNYATVGASLAVGYTNAPKGPGNAVFSGNVGIGTTSTGTYKLNVSGSTNTSSLYLNGSQVTSSATELNYLHGTTVTAGGVIYGDGTKLANTGVGTSGQILQSNASGAPTWVDSSTLTAGSVAFNNILSGTNTSAAMVVGSGASLDYTGTGTINASSLESKTWETPGAIGSTTPNSGAFTTLSSSGLATLDSLSVTKYATVGASLAVGYSSAPAGPGNAVFSGNVGIGTSTPSLPLSVSGKSLLGGNVTVQGNISLTGSNQWIQSTPSSWGSTGFLEFGVDPTFASTGNYAAIYTPANKGFVLTQAGTPRFIMDTTGNIGIGTTAPLGLLNISGAAKGKALAIIDGSSANDQNLLVASQSGNTIFTLGKDGTLTDSKYATNGGVLYTDTSGVVNTTNAATDTYILQSVSGTPTWVADSGITAGNVGFSGVDSGTNTHAAMVVGSGASLDYTGTGTINASSLEGKTWEVPGAIGSTTPNSGAFTTLSSSGLATLNDLSVTKYATVGASLAVGYSSAPAGPGNAVFSGNVGIGTTAPDDFLTIAGALGGKGIHVDSSTGASVSIDRGGTTNYGLLYFKTAGTEKWAIGNKALSNENFGFYTAGSATPTVTIDTSGNVGIGVTSPTSKLYVTGGAIDIANTSTYAIDDTGGAARNVLKRGGAGVVGGTNDIMLTNRAQGGDTIIGANNGSAGGEIEAIRIKNVSGLVGIGTTSPTSLLHVSGAVTGKALTLIDGSSVNDQNLLVASQSGNMVFAIGTDGALTDSKYTNANGVLYTDGSGVIKQVSGTAGTNNCLVYNGSAPIWAACTSGGGVVTSVTNSDGSLTVSPTTGDVVASLNTSHANTWAAVQSFNSGDLKLNGATSGTITLNAAAVAGTNTLTLPAATDTLVGKATTDTFTNKTFDTAGTGNVLKINGTQVSAVTGTGSTLVLSASPTFTGTVSTAALTASGTITANGAFTANGVMTLGDGGDNFSLNSNALDISTLGAISGATTLSMSGQLTNTVSTGTAPFVLSSTTKVTNLNADLLDGIDSTSFCQVGGANCPSFATGTNWWTTSTDGKALTPLNSTMDLLIGDQATTSAKFAVLNMSGSNSPIASVSSGLNGNGAYLTADGTLATTGRTNLTLGNSSTYNTTGNVLINPNGTGSIGIGTTSPGSQLVVNSSTAKGTVDLTGASGGDFRIAQGTSIANGYVSLTYTSPKLGLTRSGTHFLWYNTSTGDVVFNNTFGGSSELKLSYGGTDVLNINNSLNVGIGTTAPKNKLDVVGSLALGTYAGVNTAPSGTSLIVSGNVGIGTSTTGQALDVNGIAQAQGIYLTQSDSHVTATAGKLGFLSSGSNEVYVNYGQGGDFYYYGGGTTQQVVFKTTGQVGIGNNAPVGLLDVAGAVKGKALAIFDEKGDQALFTASASGSTKFVIDHGGNVGIGTTSPGYTLDVAGDINLNTNANKLKVAGTQALYLPDQTSFTGSLMIGNGGGSLSHSTGLEGFYNTAVGISSGTSLSSGHENTFLGYDAGNKVDTGSSNTFLGSHAGYNNTGSGNVFIGNIAGYNETSASNRLYINNGLDSAAKPPLISGMFDAHSVGINTDIYNGALGNAALTVNQPNTAGDIFTASQSGSTKFVIDNTGNVGIGITSPTTNVDIRTAATDVALALISGTGGGSNHNSTIKLTEDNNPNNGAYLQYTGASNRFDIMTGLGSTNILSRLSIDRDSGRTGIGTTSISTYQLNVAGSLNATSYYVGGTAGATVGTAACVTTSNGIVTGSATCPASGASGVFTLDATHGVIYPINNTADLLLGGTASSSAKFAFLNMSGLGSPTASVSSGLNGSGAYLTADGTLATTNRGTLTIGNSATYNTTGNVLINPNGVGNVGIGMTNPASPLAVNGNIQGSQFVDYDNSNYFLDPAATSTSLAVVGNVGIGISNPGFRLQVSGSDSSSNGGTAGVQLSNTASGGGNWYLRIGATGTNTPAGGLSFANDTNYMMTLDAKGNLGIGTLSPLHLVDVQGAITGKSLVNFNYTSTGQDIISASRSGTTKFRLTDTGALYAASFTDQDNTSYFLDPAATGNSLLTQGNVGVGVTSTSYVLDVKSGGASTARFGTSASDGIVIGGGTGKVTAGTYDPVYNIDGSNYATFLPGMAGVKEEATGKVALTYNSQVGAYSYTIDFNNQPKDTDLWLFSRIIDPDVAKISVLMTPDTQAQTWYQADSASRTITFFANQPTSISYRMTAPRFDSDKWGLISKEDVAGLVPPPAPVAQYNPTPQAPSDNTTLFSIKTVVDSTGNHVYTLIDSLGNAIQKTDSYSKILAANIQAGYIATTDLSVSGVAKFTGTLQAQTISVAEAITAGAVNAQQIAAQTLSIATENVSIGGQTLKDYIVSVIQQSGLVLSNVATLVTPNAQIGTTQTNVISPLADNSNISLSLDNSKLNIHSSRASDSAVVASIDNAGNATFSGSLSAKDASISGTLHVGKIIADDIEGGSVNAATVSATYITNVTNIYNTASGSASASGSGTLADNTASGSGTLAATGSANLADGQSGALANGIQTDYMSPASLSAALAQVPNLTTDFAQVNQGLMVFGSTSLADTSVAGQLAVDGNLILSDSSINVLGADLQIQPIRQGGVAFEGGLIAIDTDGNLTVGGNAVFAKDVTIKGKLATSLIAPVPDQDLVIQLRGKTQNPDGSTGSTFAIKDASGSAKFTVNNLGDVIASGAGKFAQLSAGSLQIVKGAQADTSMIETVATSSAGTAVITPGETERTIVSPFVKAGSLIYLTPTSDTEGQTPYVARQTAEDAKAGTKGSFTIQIGLPAYTPITLNWWIINTNE